MGPIKLMFSGDQGSGKSTAAKYCQGWLKWNGFGEAIALKLADPLYQSLAMFSNERHRVFLQKYGDLAREIFGQDCLMKSLILREERAIAEGAKIILCDDVRTPEEHSAALERGYILIRIDADETCRQARCPGVWSPKHNTEGRLGDLYHHYRLTNNGNDIQTLFTGMDNILADIFTGEEDDEKT